MISLNPGARIIHFIIRKELFGNFASRQVGALSKPYSVDVSQPPPSSPGLPPTILNASALKQPPLATFRTSESNPANHTIEHEGRFYTVPEQDTSRLYVHRTAASEFTTVTKVFQEFCVMVRKPALEVMGYLKNADYSHPVIRYVMYGRTGCGKSLTLHHLLHYGASTGWILFNIPWVPYFTRVPNRKIELQPSTHREGRWDEPYEGLLMLQRFKSHNSDLLKQLDLKVSTKYVWNRRESTEEGVPLMELIEHGISRPKFSCDVIGALIKELKLHSSQNKCKTLVLIDGLNAVFHTSRHKRSDRTLIPAEELTLVSHTLKLVQNDWTNGAVVTTVDTLAGPTEFRESWLPRYLLQKEGFEMLDPFVPIHVSDFTEKEINSCLDYYLERKWIQHEGGLTPKGRDELIFLSAYNPARLWELTRFW